MALEEKQRIGRMLNICNIPKVYYDQSVDYSKKLKNANPLSDNLLISGGKYSERTIYLVSILKDIIKRKPGAMFFRFEYIIEHLRQNQYLEILGQFKGKRFVGIDNFDFGYIGNLSANNVFKRFCSLLMEVYGSPSDINIFITTPHKYNVLESKLPRPVFEVIDGDFESIIL